MEKPVDCVHWEACGRHNGGRCLIDAPGNSIVSISWCTTKCEVRQPAVTEAPPEVEIVIPEDTVGKLAYFAKGAVKAAKAAVQKATGTGATGEWLKARQDVCNGCDKKTAAVGGMTTKCSVCGCVLPLKQAASNETCPIGKWTDVDTRFRLKVIQ